MYKLTVLLPLITILFSCEPSSIEVDRTHSPDNKQYLGIKYKTKVDLFVFRYSDEKSGLNLRKIEERYLKDGKMSSTYPYQESGSIIMGVLQKESELISERVISIRSSIGASYMKARVLTDGPYKGKLLGTGSIDKIDGPLILDPEIAERLTPEKKT